MSARLAHAPAPAGSARPERPPRPSPPHAGAPLYLQRAALAVDAPTSRLEQEAEEVSAGVMRMPAGPCCAGCAGDGSCEEPRERAVPGTVQRAAGAGGPSAVPKALGSPGPGSPLDADVRGRLEPAVGTDLGHVRVHTGAEAEAKASALHAKAFTHGSHVWVGRGQSPRDLGLMAHEAVHVVQQGAAGPDGGLLQRRPADYRHPEDGSAVRDRLLGRIDEEVEDPPSDVAPAEARRRMGEVKPAEVRGKETELAPAARPDVDRPAQARPGVEQAATTTKEEAAKPTEPIVEGEGGEEKKEEEKKEPEAPGAAAAAAATAAAEAAFALADSFVPPAPEPAVTAPEPVEPLDAGGGPLPDDGSAEAQIAAFAEQAQALRDQGLELRIRAAALRADAAAMRGNLALVEAGVGTAQASLGVAEEQLAYRGEVASQAKEALVLAEDKATAVAAEAPGYVEQAAEGAEESGPMAAEASDMAGESAESQPEDEDAAADAQEQRGKIEEARGGATTLDEAIGSTGEGARGLIADAEHARGVNEQTRTRLTGVDETLAATGERLGELGEQSATAREAMAAVAGQPEMLDAEAQALDAQGAALIAASDELEARIGAVRDRFAADLRSVPPQEMLPVEETAAVQRAPEDEAGEEAEVAPEALPAATVEEAAPPGPAAPGDRYEEREQIDLVSGLPAWLTGVKPQTEAQRQASLEAAKRRRDEDLATIGAWSGGKFEDLNAAQKVAIALGLNFRRLWRRILGIGWPDISKVGKFLVSLLDPRTALAGVVSGLSMTLSGFANLLSAEQWRRNPLQNLLKSAADIATGITIVLGSITALAGAIAAIMTAITILSFGFAAPITGPIIAFCTSVMVTVGGWTIAVGKIALILQALVLIKNLYDAAVAESADELQAQSEQIGADAAGMLNVGMQIVGAKVAQVGGRVTQRGIVGAGGGVRAAASLGAGARVLAGRGVRGIGGFARDLVRRGPRRMFRDWRVARAARPPQPPRPSLRQRFRSWREELREMSQPLPKGQAYSADYLLGGGVRSFAEAADVSAITRLNVRIADLAARGTPDAAAAAARLARQRAEHEARRLMRRLQGIEPGVPPPGAAGAPATITRPTTYARGLMSADEAYAAYNAALARAGGREVGIFQNLETGEFAIRTGDFGSVRPPWDGEWRGLLHFHPNPENVLTYRLPAPQDFQGPLQRFAATGRAAREVVEFDIPGVGRGRTEFGVTPGRDPYYVTIHQPDGRSITLRFADDEAYRAYWSSRTTFVEPGTQQYKDLFRSLDEWLRDLRNDMPDLPLPGERTMTGIGRPGGPPGPPGRSLLAEIDEILTSGPPPGRPSPLELARARAALDAGSASADDFVVLLREAIADARAMIKGAQEPVLSWEVLRITCGTGRDCSAAAFAALGERTPQPITIYRMQAQTVFDLPDAHGFNVVVLPNGERYLVDPTFGQFMRPGGRPVPARIGGQLVVLEGEATGDILRSLPGGPALARDLVRDGLVRLDDATAQLYARGLGIAEADAPAVGGRLLADHGTMMNQAEIVDIFGSGPPPSIVLRTPHDWTPSDVITQANQWIKTLREQGDPHNLIPELVQVIRRLGGNVQ